MPYIGKKPADIIATVIDTTTGTFSGEVDAGSLDVSGNADIDGITNLDNTDIDGTLNVQGETTLQTHLNMGDNDIIKLGDGADLQIYHDGSNSIIKDNGTSNIRIQTTGSLQIGDEGYNEIFATFNDDSSVNLFFDGSLKFNTSSTGIDVTGTATMDGLTVEKSAAVGATFNRLTSSGHTIDVQVVGNTVGSLGSDVGGQGIFNIDAVTAGVSSGKILLTTNDVRRQLIDNNGDISFYEDTGTTPKFSWSSSNETIAIGSGASSTATISAYSRTVSAGLPSALRIIENTGASSYWDIGANNGAGPNLNFYVNANTSPKLTLTSGGNVGIGTGSPDRELDLVKSTDNCIMSITSSTSNISGVVLGDTADDDRGGILYNNSSDYLYFLSNASERMRIDSSGNLLVAKTTLDYDTPTGHVLRADGFYSSVRSGGNCVDFNRLSSDGEIIRVSRDGADVGSIGSSSGRLYIGSLEGSDSFIRFNSNEVVPSTSAGAARDNAINLGASAARFKDLYLSGGVYVGGTGSANYLDDYEEGTFTPSYSGGGGPTFSAQVGRYTKIGNRVIANLYIAISNKNTMSGTQKITALPFVSENTGNNYNACSIWMGAMDSTGVFNGNQSREAFQVPNTTNIQIYAGNGSGGVTQLNDTHIANTTDIMLTVSYNIS